MIAKSLRCWHFHVAEGPSAAIARAAAPPAADAATESTSGPEDSFMLQQSAGMFTFQNILDTIVICLLRISKSWDSLPPLCKGR